MDTGMDMGRGAGLETEMERETGAREGTDPAWA